MRRLRKLFNEQGEILQRVLDLLEGENRAVEELELRCAELSKQNSELFDRLMARDWESFAIYRSANKDAVKPSGGKPLAPEEDEENAGTFMDVRTEE